MRILAVHNILWSHYKASIYSKLQLSCSKLGFDFHVLQLAYTEKSRESLSTDLSNHHYSYEVLFKDKAFENIPTLTKCFKLLKSTYHYKPTILYLNGYYDPSYWLLMLYCQMNSIKIIIDFESTQISRERKWWKETLKRYFLKNCSGLVCLGTQAGIYAQSLGVPTSKILSTKNIGVDNERLFALFEPAFIIREQQKQKYQLPKYNFIYAGRFVARKNLRLLIEVFDRAQQASKNGKSWGLILSGSGNEEKDLRTLANETKYKKVYFFSPCEWFEVPERYALGDVAVLPSLFEPFGFVTNEAMVYGMPVLVSNRCGSAFDLVSDGVNGYTFDPFDKDDICQKLILLMDNPDKFDAMGKEGRKMIADWRPDVIEKQLLGAFQAVIIPENT